MSILVTGGLGYIGSHIVVELMQAGKDVVVLDNLVNSQSNVKQGIERIVGKIVKYEQVDLCDKAMVDRIFAKHDITSVIHLAALKAVGESVQEPLRYYGNNVVGTINLLQAMSKCGVDKLVFSSSACVYGVPKSVPIPEDTDIQAINPYGGTKVTCERIIADYAVANSNFGVVNLRYFNPIGAHRSYLIGENPKGKPNNIMPLVCNVAVGKMQQLQVYGSDYDTVDGTCERDYVHVVDLAKGHMQALSWIDNNGGIEYINLGTGKGTTVLQLLKAFELANGIQLNCEIVGRRAGDATSLVASVDKARKLLGWQAMLTVEDMCRDHYQWVINSCP